MLKVVFCPDGQPVNDFYACDFADSKIYEYALGNGTDMEVRFSTECALDAFVLRVMEGRFPANEISFYYIGLDMDEEAQFEFEECLGTKIPKGIREIGTRNAMTNKILKLGYEKMKARRAKKNFSAEIN